MPFWVMQMIWPLRILAFATVLAGFWGIQNLYSLQLDPTQTEHGLPWYEQIFAPFFTTYPHGTGLGLSLVQRVIEGHDGVIREIGKPNEGAVFEIFLPQADSKRQGI